MKPRGTYAAHNNERLKGKPGRRQNQTPHHIHPSNCKTDVIDGKLPTLEKKLKLLSLRAKEKQEHLKKTLDIVEDSAGKLSNEMQKCKRVEEMLEASQARKSQQKRTINGANTQINVLYTTLQSKDGEICVLNADLEAKCKNLASTNTQLEMSNIKCAGVERESNDLKTRTRMLEHEGNQPKASRAVAQGTWQPRSRALQTSTTKFASSHKGSGDSRNEREAQLKSLLAQLQVKHEIISKEASDNATSGRIRDMTLPDGPSPGGLEQGDVGQDCSPWHPAARATWRKGVGMIVRTAMARRAVSRRASCTAKTFSSSSSWRAAPPRMLLRSSLATSWWLLTAPKCRDALLTWCKISSWDPRVPLCRWRL